MNKEIGMMLPKKSVNTNGVGESNNYYEDIYNIYRIAANFHSVNFRNFRNKQTITKLFTTNI